MTRQLAVAVALALVGQPALAKGSHGGGGGHGRGGGSSGRSSSVSHGGHSSSHGGHSSSHGGHSSSPVVGSASGRFSDHRSGWTSSRSDLRLAERRHPLPGTGRGWYPYRYPYYRGYYRSYYRSPFYGSFYFGWPYYYDPLYYDPFYYGFTVSGYDPPYSDFGYRYEDPGPDSLDRGRYDDRDRDPAVEDPDSGELRVRAWPRDATIYVDGQFRGTAREVGVLHLRPGRHTIEVVRPGFRPQERELEIGRGETRELAVSLQRP